MRPTKRSKKNSNYRIDIYNSIGNDYKTQLESVESAKAIGIAIASAFARFVQSSTVLLTLAITWPQSAIGEDPQRAQ
ncbi:MAG: hypothetical protein WCH37_02105 [Synechococcaceae cyanobacterium ELA182]